MSPLTSLDLICHDRSDVGISTDDCAGGGDAATKRRRTTIIVVPFAIMVVELARETNGVASTPPDLQLQLNQVSNKIIFQWRTSPNQVAQLSWAT